MARNTDRLGERLVKSGHISSTQLESAIAQQKQQGGKLGDILVERNYLTQKQLSDFIFESRSSKIGEVLLEQNYITDSQLALALDYQRRNGGRIGDICVAFGYISEDRLQEVMRNRKKERSKLGETLIQKELITEEQLDHAVEMQQRSGGRLGEILMFMGYVTEEELFRELANQSEMGRTGEEDGTGVLERLPFSLATKYNAVIINKRGNVFIVAVVAPLTESQIEEIETHLGRKIEQVLATQSEMDQYWDTVYRKRQKHQSVFDLYDSQPDNSAIVTFTSKQLGAMIAIGVILVFGLIINWRVTLFSINIFFQILYAVMTILKLYIVLKGERKNTQIKYGQKRLAEIDEAELPIYTLLIPVYKETEVVKRLIENIAALDYPQYKLDVRILLEEDDTETIELVRSMNLPSNYSAIVVPTSNPQTKPKACNYGLIHAKGEYVVIYDAEDRPEPDQLKKAYLAFKELPDEYVCIQAKLNYFNSNQNFLTKLFTQEYSMWFELLLVGIMQMDVPVPLGGTSNHFKISFLKEVGGWDPFNVTEDADLGIRLFKFDYKTAILDSRTWEEANSNVFNWIR